MITGNKNTSAGAYNGGFENLSHLHEDWTSRTCTIKGSFVCPWNSAISTGSWVYGGNWYSAPTRNWSFDTRFNTAGTLPPFTPMVINSRIIAWQTTN